MTTKRSFWPYGILTAFIVFVLGTIALIVLASSSNSDLVSPDYYEQEIRYQGQIDRLNRTAQLEEQVRITYSKETQRITILLPEEHVLQKPAGRIQLYRPSAAGLDRNIKLELDTHGVQSVDAEWLLPGLWKVRVQWTVQNKDYFVDKSIVVERGEAGRRGVSPVSNFNGTEDEPSKAFPDNASVTKTETAILETGDKPVLR